MVVEQQCVVYKISIPKCLYFLTYFNRRLGTWLWTEQLYLKYSAKLSLWVLTARKLQTRFTTNQWQVREGLILSIIPINLWPTQEMGVRDTSPQFQALWIMATKLISSTLNQAKINRYGESSICFKYYKFITQKPQNLFSNRPICIFKFQYIVPFAKLYDLFCWS